MAVTRDQIDKCIRDQKDVFLKDYKKIVEIPSVSSQPDHKNDMQKCAELALSYLKLAGADAQIFQTNGHPGVFGHIENKPGAPTVAIYNHLDVQPAEKGKDGWTMDPFVFTEKAGRFYGRGTTDDKGPAMTALWAAKITRELRIPINIEFIWELEEEIGCIHFEEFLAKAKTHVRAHSIAVSDTQWIAAGKPAIGKGLRGIVTFELTLRTAKHDMHSGVVGGIARNPVAELLWTLNQCVDGRTGEIKIPGLDKTWDPPTKSEIEELVETGFSVSKFKSDVGMEKMRNEEVHEVLKRIWLSPTFEVHSVVGGYQGPGVKTAIAPEARAKCSMRLVGHQDPKAIFELVKAHIQKINPDIEIELEGMMHPYTAPKKIPHFAFAEEAIQFGFGPKPAYSREGGSIGAVVLMSRMIQVPILLLGLSLPQDNYHGPDESFAWEQIEGGVRTFVKYFELLSSSK